MILIGNIEFRTPNIVTTEKKGKPTFFVFIRLFLYKKADNWKKLCTFAN